MSQSEIENKPFKVLALDLGTTMGWALKSEQIVSGTINFKPQRFEGGGMRFLRLRRWLQKKHEEVGGIDLLVFEEVRRHKGTDAAHIYGGFLGVLSVFCEEFSIPYQGVGVGTIKKYITGSGNASKQEVIDVMKAVGHSVKDDNEADALALLYYADEKI